LKFGENNMSRELWLLRHGKSDRYAAAADIDRPLKKRGKRAAEKMGSWMRQQGLIPDWVICSPAERARATLKRVCEKLEVDLKDSYQDKRLYGGGIESLKTVLSECPREAQRVLLVGHNPELEDFLIEMAGAANLPDTGKLMPTAALARLAMPDDWSDLPPGGAKLLAITYPKSLFGTGEA
jgi:phosphohistidine phosphatase